MTEKDAWRAQPSAAYSIGRDGSQPQLLSGQGGTMGQVAADGSAAGPVIEYAPVSQKPPLKKDSSTPNLFIVVVFTIIVLANIITALEMGIRENELSNDYSELSQSFNSYRNGVESRWGLGQDACLFITPNDTAVAAKTREVLSGGANTAYDGTLTAADITALYNWIQNIIIHMGGYNNDTPTVSPAYYSGGVYNREELRWDTFLYPNETLRAQKGDCEDWANLLLSMILSENNSAKAVCAELEFNDRSGHVSVFVKNGAGQAFILDPTGEYISSAFAAVQTEFSRYSSQWQSSSQLSITRVYGVYNDTAYQDVAGTQAFFSWFAQF